MERFNPGYEPERMKVQEIETGDLVAGVLLYLI